MNVQKLKKKNFIWNFLGLTVNSFNSLIFLIIVNRINGTSEAGVFTYAYSLICLIYFIGVYFGRTYQVAAGNKEYNNREFVYSRIISCSFMFISTGMFLFIFKYNSFKTLIILLICIFRLIEAFSDVLYGIMQKENKLYKSGFSLFIKGILGLIFFLIIDYFTKNLIFTCCSLIVVNLLILFLYDIPSSKEYVENSGSIKHSFGIFGKSFPVFVFSFLNIYLVNSSKYVLDFYDSADMQNVFGIILMPGTILSLCCQYLLNPYILTLTNYYKSNKIKLFNSLLFKVAFYVIAVGLLSELLCFIMGIPILNFIYGIDLSPYKIDLLIIILGAIALALVSILSSALTIMKKNYIQMYIFVFDSIFSFILSIILVKKMSLLGASLSYMIIMILQLINFLIFYRYFMYKRKGKIKRNNDQLQFDDKS